MASTTWPYPDIEDILGSVGGMGINVNPGSSLAAQAAQAAISPTQVAAAQRSAQQSSQAPYQPTTGVAAQGVGSSRQPQVPTPGLGGTPSMQVPSGRAASSSQFPMPHTTSNEWFGGLDEYGALTAGSSPYAFWDLYGSQALGLEPGSMTAQFYNENYNPFAMSAALGYGQDLNSYDARLAAGTSLANLLAQPGTAFFDPATMVGNVLSAIANPGNNEQFNQLSAVVLGASTPDQQLANLVSYLQEALSAAMPPDVLQAYLAYINKIGSQIVTDAFKNGIAQFEGPGSKNNIATYLLQRIGPTGGL